MSDYFRSSLLPRLALVCLLTPFGAICQPGTGALKADLVLTSDFCNAEMKQGNGWTAAKQDFLVGEVLCPAIKAAVSRAFRSVNVLSEVPQPGASTADVLLVPKVDDISATERKDTELFLVVEWTVSNSAGKMLWVGAIRTSAGRNTGALGGAKQWRLLTEETVASVVKQSITALSRAPELTRLAK